MKEKQKVMIAYTYIISAIDPTKVPNIIEEAYPTIKSVPKCLSVEHVAKYDRFDGRG